VGNLFLPHPLVAEKRAPPANVAAPKEVSARKAP